MNKRFTTKNILPEFKSPELYPSLYFKPSKHVPNETDNFLVDIKQELRTHFKNSIFYINKNEEKKKFEKYTDKYETYLNQIDSNKTCLWNYSLFPDELKPKTKILKKQINHDQIEADFKSKLDILEDVEDEEEKEDADKEEKEEEFEGFLEEDNEDENDYALTYFDNGEDYLNDSDDNLDREATF